MLEFFEGYFQFLTKLEDNYFKVINKKKAKKKKHLILKIN